MNNQFKKSFNDWIEDLEKVRDLSENTLIGYKNDIEKFIEECHKGPIFSKVLKIDISMVSYTEHKNFEIKV